MSKRDETIDRLRGFAMFWVIVVHVLYWGNFFDNERINLLKSFCLFEMPLFFFITGASNSFTKVNGYFYFVYRRYKRALIPYWVFAIICAGLSIAKYSISGGKDIFTGVKILLSWLIPINRQITSVSYLTWALWFIPVYLCVILIIPLLKQMKQSQNCVKFVFLLLAVFVVTCVFKMGWVQNVAFYSLWTYIGLFYSDIMIVSKQNCFRKSFVLIATVGAAMIIVCYFIGQSIDMQHNKFPPNITFLAFSIVMMTMIVLMIPCFNRAFEHLEKYRMAKIIVDLFSTRSMTIFLYQVFAFNLTIRFANTIISGNSIIASIVKSMICLITTIPICTVLAIVFGNIEKIGSKAHRKER